MDLKEFVTGAIRTESQIDEVRTNEMLLTCTLQAMICLGSILDQIKKNVYYGKEIDVTAIVTHHQIASEALALMSAVEVDKLNDDEANNTLPVNPRLFHAIIGIATESTELLEALDLYGRDMDNTNILEEFGDLDWYKAIGVDELNGDWENILVTIIEKLKKRYPDKFTSEDAINRDLDAERAILDTMEKE